MKLKRLVIQGIVLVLTFAMILGSTGAAYATSGSDESAPGPTIVEAVVVVQGERIAISADAVGNVIGHAERLSDGTYNVGSQVIVRCKGEGRVDVAIEMNEQGELILSEFAVSKAGSTDTADDAMAKEAIPELAKTRPEIAQANRDAGTLDVGKGEADTRSATWRHGWAKSWLECPVGIHVTKITSEMEYYDSGSYVDWGRNGKITANWFPASGWQCNDVWGYWKPYGPSYVYIVGHGEFDNWIPGDQKHTHVSYYEGQPNGGWYYFGYVDRVPSPFTHHTSGGMEAI